MKKNSILNESIDIDEIENTNINPLMRDVTMNSIKDSKKDYITRDFSMSSIQTTQNSPSRIQRDQTMHSIKSKETNKEIDINDCSILLVSSN